MSAASSAAAMIRLVISMWFAMGRMGTGPAPDRAGPVRCWGAAGRMPASSSAGGELVIWAAAVDPADVPMIRSAPVTSSPASDRPAMTPIPQALPAEPPPWRTSARSPAVACGGEEGVVFMGVAFRQVPGGRSRWRLRQSRDRGRRGAPTADTAFMGSHLLPLDHDHWNDRTPATPPQPGLRPGTDNRGQWGPEGGIPDSPA